MKLSKMFRITLTRVLPVGGEGAAPTGAYCTVQAAEPLMINVITAVTLKSGYDLPTVTVEITETVTEYLKTIAFKQGLCFICDDR